MMPGSCGGAIARCEMRRCMAPRAQSGSASERGASAIVNGSRTSSACANAAACSAGEAPSGTAVRRRCSARSAASFTSGWRRRASKESVRRSASTIAWTLAAIPSCELRGASAPAGVRDDA